MLRTAASFLSSSGGFVAIAGLLVLLAGCDSVDEEEKDCHYAFGSSWPCMRVAYYHRYPAWHPDGQRISYYRHDEERDWIDGIYVYDLSTRTEHLVLDASLISKSSQAWSPDGEWIVFGSGAQIYKVRPDGSDLTQLTFSRENFSPAWSPDGEWIAYTDRTPIPHHQVGLPDSVLQRGRWVMRPDGSDKQWLPHVRGHDPTWHPSGDKILGHLFLPPAILLQNYVHDPTRRDTLIAHGQSGNVYATSYSADGLFIAFDLQYMQGLYMRYDVFKVEVATNQVVSLTGHPETMFGKYPAWSPDGQTIAYLNAYWREGVIWLMDADGSNKRRMGPVAPPIESPYR